MLREKREKVSKEDSSIAARNVIARLGKGELRTDAALREQVLDVLVVHRYLIPTARKGHYMMMVPHAYGLMRLLRLLGGQSTKKSHRRIKLADRLRRASRSIKN